MLFVDLETLKGVKVKFGFRKNIKNIKEIEFLKFTPEELKEKEIATFIPNPEKISLRFFNFPFKGKMAQDAARVELEEEGFSKYKIWEKMGSVIALIYDEIEIKDFKVRLLEFKPATLCALSDIFQNSIFVDVSIKTVSLAFFSPPHILLGFFNYNQKNLEYILKVFYHSIPPEKRGEFIVFGEKADIFPLPNKKISLKDILGEEAPEDPSFVSPFLLSIYKEPKFEIISQQKINLGEILSNSIPITLTLFISSSILYFTENIRAKILKNEISKLNKEMVEIFKSTFPDKSIVDPYEQMKSAVKTKKGEDGIRVFYEFANLISEYTLRVEEFSFDGENFVSQIKIPDVATIDKIREKLAEKFEDVKVTSTFKSKDEKFVMRISGKIRTKKSGEERKT